MAIIAVGFFQAVSFEIYGVPPTVSGFGEVGLLFSQGSQCVYAIVIPY